MNKQNENVGLESDPMSDDAAERNLLRRVQLGDTIALRQLLDHYVPRLVQMAQKRHVDDYVVLESIVEEIVRNALCNKAAIEIARRCRLITYLNVVVSRRLLETSSFGRYRAPATRTLPKRDHEAARGEPATEFEWALYCETTSLLGPVARRILSRLSNGRLNVAQIVRFADQLADSGANKLESIALRQFGRAIKSLRAARLTVEGAWGTANHVEAGSSLSDYTFDEPRSITLSWLECCADPWLASTAGPRLSHTLIWERLAAYGMVVRLYRPTSSVDAHTLVARTANGEADSAVPSIRKWIRQLSRDRLDAFRNMAALHVSALRLALEDDTALSIVEASARSRFAQLAFVRDDLEGVCLLLREADHLTDLVSRLVLLDVSGRNYRFNLPAHLTSDDERLERISIVDPNAWWGDLSQELLPW